eukprot:TRINITY_DN20076_c0_g1_i1.p1 TRINITY_DN20076_c0_g1~~TRINITY_DN20076_c0_g1_i1.p1  ORF type:complete len:792 (+),score=111.07 TRINITY_DN20076_c0_g1_i1:34-2376(+)
MATSWHVASLIFLAVVRSCLGNLQRGAGGPGWRPGAETISFRDEELNIRPTAERHAACGFEVVDAKNVKWTREFMENLSAPLLVTGLLDSWTAAKKWNKKWVKKVLKTFEDIRIHPWNVSNSTDHMSDMNTVSSSPTALKDVVNYFDLWNKKDDKTGAYLEPNAIVHYTKINANDPEFEKHAKTPKEIEAFVSQRQLALNAFGTGHGIHRHYAAWQAQVVGYKSWYLFPPLPKPEGTFWETDPDAGSHLGFPHEEQPILQNSICGYRPLRKLYKDNVQFCVQAPGEVVLIPDFYWHSTCSLDNFSIGAGGFFNTSCKYKEGECADLLKSHGYPRPPKKKASNVRPDRVVTGHGAFGAIPLRDGVLRRVGSMEARPGVDAFFRAFDDHCWTENKEFCMGMAIGDVKGPLLEEVVAEWVLTQPAGPLKGAEFGSLLGYSAMRIAKRLPASSIFYAVEPRYKEDEVKEAVDNFLVWTDMTDTIQYKASLSFEVIDEFKNQPEPMKLDVVSIDHLKDDYMNCLKQVVAADLLRNGSLVLADNIILFSIIDLLQYLRFSGLFTDYRLYYSEAEYDEYHGKPSPRGGLMQLMPDGLVTAIYAGPGKGQVFNSPNAAECAAFKDCGTCLSNLCGWCVQDRSCVPDVQGGSCRQGPRLGVFGDMKCVESAVPPGGWIGPQNAAPHLRRGFIPDAARHGQSAMPQGDRQVTIILQNDMKSVMQVFFMSQADGEILVDEIPGGEGRRHRSEDGNQFRFKVDGKEVHSHTVVAARGNDQIVRVGRPEHSEL